MVGCAAAFGPCLAGDLREAMVYNLAGKFRTVAEQPDGLEAQA